LGLAVMPQQAAHIAHDSESRRSRDRRLEAILCVLLRQKQSELKHFEHATEAAK